MIFTAILVFILCSVNPIIAQTIEPKILLQIENENIDGELYAASFKRTTHSKGNLKFKLTYHKKAIKVKIPDEIIDNVDSIEIHTSKDFPTKVVDIIEVYAYHSNPVYHCYRCSHCTRKTTIYLYKDWGKVVRQ